MKSDMNVKLETAAPQLEHADPFLQRLIQGEHAKAKTVQNRLEEIADDATEVRLISCFHAIDLNL